MLAWIAGVGLIGVALLQIDTLRRVTRMSRLTERVQTTLDNLQQEVAEIREGLQPGASDEEVNAAFDKIDEAIESMSEGVKAAAADPSDGGPVESTVLGETPGGRPDGEATDANEDDDEA